MCIGARHPQPRGDAAADAGRAFLPVHGYMFATAGAQIIEVVQMEELAAEKHVRVRVHRLVPAPDRRHGQPAPPARRPAAPVMRLYAFHCGGERADMSAFDPFDEKVGTKIEIPYFCYLITHPEGNVLFDTGGHPDLVRDPRGRLGAAADLYEITMQEGDDIVSQLARIGVTPADVPHVVQSHLHYDHAGCIEYFPDATVYAQHDELAFAFWPAVYQRALYVRADFDGPVRWRELRGEHDVFGDGRVVCVPTPGHSPGTSRCSCGSSRARSCSSPTRRTCSASCASGSCPRSSGARTRWSRASSASRSSSAASGPSCLHARARLLGRPARSRPVVRVDTVSVLPQEGVVSFARGVPTPDLFPIEELAECAARAVREHGRVALNYGDPAATRRFARRIGARHGVDAGRVLLTPGSLLGLRIAAQLLIAERSRRVLVEAPTYDRMLHLLGDLGADVVPSSAAGRPRPRHARAPARAASRGRRSSTRCRRSTTRRAAPSTPPRARRSRTSSPQHELPVLEDDPYGLLRFEGETPPSLNALLRWRGAGRLATFASSFSKSVAPGLRVGYLVLPERLVPEATALALRLFVSPPLLPQAQLQAFLEAGLLEPHLVRRPGGACASAGTRCSTGSRPTCRRPARLAPRAATSRGSSCPRRSTRTTSRRARPAPASPSCPARRSSRTAAVAAPPASRTAGPRRRRSATARRASARSSRTPSPTCRARSPL